MPARRGAWIHARLAPPPHWSGASCRPRHCVARRSPRATQLGEDVCGAHHCQNSSEHLCWPVAAQNLTRGQNRGHRQLVHDRKCEACWPGGYCSARPARCARSATATSSAYSSSSSSCSRLSSETPHPVAPATASIVPRRLRGATRMRRPPPRWAGSRGPSDSAPCPAPAP